MSELTDLEWYGHHEPDCALVRHVNPCDCGLDEAIRRDSALRTQLAASSAREARLREALGHACGLLLQPSEDFDAADHEWVWNTRAALADPPRPMEGPAPNLPALVDAARAVLALANPLREAGAYSDAVERAFSRLSDAAGLTVTRPPYGAGYAAPAPRYTREEAAPELKSMSIKEWALGPGRTPPNPAPQCWAALTPNETTPPATPEECHHTRENRRHVWGTDTEGDVYCNNCGDYYDGNDLGCHYLPATPDDGKEGGK